VRLSLIGGSLPPAGGLRRPREADVRSAILGVALLLAASARAELDAVEREISAYARAHAGAMRETLARWVAINSGSRNAAGIAQLQVELRRELEALAFAVEGLEEGSLLRARRPGPTGSPRILLIGHVDTVFEPGSESDALPGTGSGALAEAGDGRASGPGAADMKGGLVVMLHALRALAASGDLGRASWIAILNSDEELGSPGSRAMIEAEARAADLGFVFESVQADGAMVRSRRGIGEVQLEIEGVAAHAGSAPEEGHSAILELAHKVIALEALADPARGLSVNTGTIRGGSKRNIVPEQASALIDLRFDDPQSGAELLARIEALAAQPSVPGTRTRIRSQLHRPAKPATPATDELLARHAQVARDLGLAAPAPVHAGGGTDGSLAAAVGLATLDSMGVRGGRAHTREEFVVLESLPERAALAAILWRRLIDGRLDAPGVRR
jgi:glutamate carboxypeptidase